MAHTQLALLLRVGACDPEMSVSKFRRFGMKNRKAIHCGLARLQAICKTSEQASKFAKPYFSGDQLYEPAACMRSSGDGSTGTEVLGLRIN